MDWRMTNGFNFSPKKKENQSQKNESNANRQLFIDGTSIKTQTDDILPQKIKVMGYSHSFIENMNFMLVFMLVEFIVSVTLIFISYKCGCLHLIGHVLLKQFFVTIFIFNCFNIAFSFGLHLRYATADNTDSYILSTSAAALSLAFCLIALGTLTFFSSEQSGQFKSKFKRNWLTKAYIPISILYRLSLGFYIAYSNDEDY